MSEDYEAARMKALRDFQSQFETAKPVGVFLMGWDAAVSALSAELTEARATAEKFESWLTSSTGDDYSVEIPWRRALTEGTKE